MAKTKSRKTRNSEASNNNNQNPLTIEEWMKLPHPTLSLRCGEYGLPAKGQKLTLATRLHDHMQKENNPSQQSRSATSNTNVIDVNTATTTNTGTLTFQPDGTDFNVATGNPIDIIPATNGQSITQQQLSQNMGTDNVTHTLCQAVAVLQEQQSNLQGTLERVLEGMQGNQPVHKTGGGADTTLQVPTATLQIPTVQSVHELAQSNLVAYNPANPQVEINATNSLNPTYGFDSQQQLRSSTGTSLPTVGGNNPYLPPPMSNAVATKIKGLLYVDFHELITPLLPTAINMAGITDGSDEGHYHLTQSQVPGGPVSFKKRATGSPISNYATWVMAWNVFYEATLHSHPNLHFELFSYFKHIAEYAVKHKFNYLLAYDKAHRMHIAAQKHLPPARQTASWTKFSPNLYNAYLRDNLLPQCNVCLAFGHFEKQCKDVNSAAGSQHSQAQVAQTTQLNWAAQQLPLPPTLSPAPQTFRNASSNPSTGPPSKHCFRFNRGQPCRLPCHFSHTCNRCTKPAGHAAINCPNTTTSGFRPQG